MAAGKLVLALVVALAGAALWFSGATTVLEPEAEPAPFRLNDLLGRADPAQGFATVERGTALRFPRDHAAHPDFRNEWWYLTGQLQQDGEPARRFGFQFTLFRFALAPPSADADAQNGWLQPQLYMAHAALTHIGAGQHRSEERFSRVGPGLAGAGGEPLRFWLQDWQLRSQRPGALFPAQLQLALPEQRWALSLAVRSTRPPQLQGEVGLSVKNAEGGASYYYSYPRLAVSGSLSWEGETLAVNGSAWLDHEWSSNNLAPDQAGWDWFALQLDDGTELMFYRFRDAEGATGHYHLARLSAEGVRDLSTQEHRLEVLDQWHSPEGRRYPAGWRLQLPDEGLDLRIEPLLADQEMRHSVRYWEGAVRVSGSHRGQGYVELTGY